MLKYSGNAKTLLTASALFLLIIGAIAYIGCYGNVPVPPEANAIYEKQTDIGHLFFNNVALALSNVVLAIPTFGLYPLSTMLANATALGAIVKYLIDSERQILIFKLVPHGILELFGLAFSVALILVLTVNVIKSVPVLIKGEENLRNFCVNHLKYLASGIFVVILIFFVAACVETAVSNIKFL